MDNKNGSRSWDWFCKNLKHNLTLISNISLFHSLGFPILVELQEKIYQSNSRKK